MGFAILFVVWFHSPVFLDFFPVKAVNRAFFWLKTFGYGCVDIFLLLSGLGIYSSLEKNDVSTFIKNRLLRITPVWWTYLLFLIVVRRFVFGLSFTFTEILGFATYTGFWLGLENQGAWYVYTIVLFYLISPVLYSLLKTSTHKTAAGLTLAAIALLVSASFIGSYKLIALSRLPVYVVGMYFSAALRDRPIRRRHWILLLLSFVLGVVLLFVVYTRLAKYLWTFGLWWYPFLLIAPTFSLLLAKLFRTCSRFLRPLLKVFSLLGRSSLEILLVSVFAFTNTDRLRIPVRSGRVRSLLLTLIAAAIGILFHLAIDHLTKRVLRHRRNGARSGGTD